MDLAATALPARRCAAASLAGAALLLLLPAPGAAQDLGGAWVEVWSSEAVQVQSWGEHCGPQPKARGRVASNRPVTASLGGGVLSFPGLKLRSDQCLYASLAKKQSYDPGSFTLRCSTPAGASPFESAVYRFTPASDGQELRYTARVSAFWKLQGDTCSAEVRYERLFRRPAEAPPASAPPPVASAPEASPSTAAAPPRSVAAANASASPRSAPPRDPEEGILLIPVEVERSDEGPAGGSATPMITQAPRGEPERGVSGTLIAAVLGALLLGTAGAFLLAWAARRRAVQRAEEEEALEAALQPAASPRRPISAHARFARTMLLDTRGTALDAGSSGVRPPKDEAAEPDEAPLDRLDTSMAAMGCARCGRRFEMGAEFCPFDGQRLAAVEDAAQARGAGFAVCPRCSRRYPEDAAFCPEDGESLVPQEDLDEDEVASPLLICPTCQREFMPGQTTCPDDATPLLPIAGRRTTGLPLVGAGPLTRICPSCGTRYPAEAEFCGVDGGALVHVN